MFLKALKRRPLINRRFLSDLSDFKSEVMPSFYDSTVEKYALQKITRLSLKYMMDFGRDAPTIPEKQLKSAQFVQREMPIRLAHRLMDLHYLPWIVISNPHIQRVYRCYFHAFNVIRKFPTVSTMSENTEFIQVLDQLVNLHSPLLDALAKGLKECRMKPIVGPQLQLDGFLDSMLQSRISRRLIAEQHMYLQNSREGFIGTVQTELPLWQKCFNAAEAARAVCLDTYGIAPIVTIDETSKDFKIPYIPAHLHYMLYEIFKNSFRATVEHYLRKEQKTMIPSINVMLCGSPQGVTIKVSDQGGGIPDDKLSKVFEYGYTSVSDMLQASQCNDTNELGIMLQQKGDASQVMAGLGFGLPMSRLYARFFGGELKLMSIPGYGTDVYLMLKSLDHLG